MTAEEDADAGEVDEETSFEELLETIEDGPERDPDGGPGEAGPEEDPFEGLAAEVEGGDDVDAHVEELERVIPAPGRARFDDLLGRVRSHREEIENASEGADVLRMPVVDPGDAVLVLQTADEAAADEVCLSAFDFADPLEHRVLLVSVGPRGHSRFPLFLEKYGSGVAELAHVHPDWEPVSGMEDVREGVVDDPEDLTQLGITVSQILGEWAETEGAMDVCLYSLSALLQHSSRRRVFRFMHLLLGRLADVGATVHVHMDAESHREETVALFREIFDLTVTVGADGVEVDE